MSLNVEIELRGETQIKKIILVQSKIGLFWFRKREIRAEKSLANNAFLV